MDFNEISDTLKSSFELEIVHPATGEGGWFIELSAPHHAESQARVSDALNRINKRKVSTTKQKEADGVDLLAARVLGWRGLKSGTEEVPYSEEACHAILANPKSFWVRSQIIDALGDPSLPFMH